MQIKNHGISRTIFNLIDSKKLLNDSRRKAGRVVIYFTQLQFDLIKRIFIRFDRTSLRMIFHVERFFRIPCTHSFLAFSHDPRYVCMTFCSVIEEKLASIIIIITIFQRVCFIIVASSEY